MAQNVAVVRATLSATSGGTTDFTTSGFGTPAAAIIVLCNANTTNNPQDGANISVGFWDGTSQRVCSIGSTDNVATTDTYRYSDDSYGALVAGSANAAYTVSSITDGIRLTLSVDNTTLQRYATVILLSGISAKALTFTPNATVNATATSASLGFAPKLIFFTTVGATAADQGSTTSNAILSFGFAETGGTHRMVGYGALTAAADSTCTLLYSETRCVGQIFNGVESWTGEVTTFGADTFTMTTRTGGSGSDVTFALALGGADLSYDVGTLTTRTTTGTQANATDIAPAALLLNLSTATGTSLETGSGANGFVIGMADSTNEYSHNYYDEDAAGTTNCGSVASSTAVVDLDSSSGGSRTDMCVATVTFDSDSFDLDYTTVDATARKGWWVVFGGGGPVTHATTGALSGQGSTIAGSAARTRVHTNTGALVGQGSEVVGAASRTRLHATDGVLQGQGSDIDGSAQRNTSHATSGVLEGQGAEIVGSAQRIGDAVVHECSGALFGQGSAMSGEADNWVMRGFWPEPKKKPKLKEVVEKVKQNPEKALDLVKDKVIEKYPDIDYSKLEINLKLQRYVAQQIIILYKKQKREEEAIILLLV